MEHIRQIQKAIKKINPDAQFIIRGTSIDGLEWTDGTTPIPKAYKVSKINEIANQPEQSAYAEQRRNAYPPIGDQLDMLWHSIDQNSELKQKYFDFYEAIKQVKVKYPKNG